MSQLNQSCMMMETKLSVYSRCRQYQRVQFLNYAWNYWTVQQNDSYVTVNSRLKQNTTLKALAEYKSGILATDSNSFVSG